MARLMERGICWHVGASGVAWYLLLYSRGSEATAYDVLFGKIFQEGCRPTTERGLKEKKKNGNQRNG